MLILELDELLPEIREHDVNTIGIQLPAGLRQRAREITEFFEGHGYEVIFAGDPSYGACDVADDVLASAGADLLVHFGHSKMIPSSVIPVIYWGVRDDIDIRPTISKNIEKIVAMGGSAGLATTVQHVHKLGDVAEILRERGVEVVVGEPIERVSYPGQVLGCSFETIEKMDVDYFIYIGTGVFHPIGISLATDREVLYCDPYTERCESVTPARNMILKKRYAMIEKARTKRDFAILVSTKKGQYRYREALEIKKLLNKKEKNCVLIFAEEINKYIIQDFDFEAFVVAACPRIAIDDASQFDKPVITIAEARLMFDDEDYRFDEIHKI